MLVLQLLGLFLLMQFAYGNGDEDLIPREFTATALNSTSIFVTWEEPNRSSELSGEYQVNVSSNTHEKQYRIRGTAGTFTNLEPSTNHTFTVRAFWKNDTPVDAVAFSFAETGPHEGLLPREFTAIALNSSSILVRWEEPERSSEFSGKYRLSFYNGRRVRHYDLEDTEGQFSKLRPSTRYAFAVRAFWTNDTPVDAAVYAYAETLPEETDLESSMSPDIPEEEVHTEGNLHGSTNSPDETTLDNDEAASLFPDQPEEEVHPGGSSNYPDEITDDNDAETFSPALSTLSETAETDGLDDALSSAPSIALCAKLANFFIIFVSLMGLRYL